VLNGTRLDGASAERLRSFVEEGGGVLVAPGESGSWPASAADLLPGRLGAVADRTEGRGGRLGFLAYDHPVFEVFSGPRSGDFTGARFYRARSFQAADTAARVLARFDDGSVALAERDTGRGRVLVWTSTLDAYWNDLALQPVFLPFVHRLVDYLAGRADALPWFTAGQVVDLADPEALERAGLDVPAEAGLDSTSEAVALTPSGGSIDLPPTDGPRYLELAERGFYTVRPPSTEPERPFMLAVNVDLSESGGGRLDPEQLAAQVTSPATGPSGGRGLGDAAALQREDRERRQSIWRWLLLGAFGLLAVETAASNWVSRRVAGTPGPAGG
jgi:hypothetical protein